MTDTHRTTLTAEEREIARNSSERDPAFRDVKENAARTAAKSIVIGGGGVILKDWSQQVDYCKYMADSKHAIPKHLRDNVGACIAVVDMATRWGFHPYGVARLCYLVNDMLAFESQLIHAIVEKFAPLKYRLRPVYDGEGESRTCTITGHFKGEVDALVYTSPLIGKINPKNSPLWKSDPDQQLFYFSTLRWARRYCPDIILGIYSNDEITDSEIAAEKHIGFNNAKDVSPKLAERLRAAKGDEGFLGEATLQSIEASINAAKEPEKKTIIAEQETGAAS